MKSADISLPLAVRLYQIQHCLALGHLSALHASFIWLSLGCMADNGHSRNMHTHTMYKHRFTRYSLYVAHNFHLHTCTCNDAYITQICTLYVQKQAHVILNKLSVWRCREVEWLVNIWNHWCNLQLPQPGYIRMSSRLKKANAKSD